MEAVTILQRHGDEQVAFKGIVGHKTTIVKETVKVQQGHLVLKENMGNKLEISEPRCDDPGTWLGRHSMSLVIF